MGTKEAVLRRRVEDGFERIRCALPALLTVTGELNTPRHAQVGRLIDACEDKAPIRVWNAADIGMQIRDIGLEGSFTQVIKTFAPKFKREGEMLAGSPREAVTALVGKMREKKLV
jgi:electron transfer flavoprotein beta subunit